MRATVPPLRLLLLGATGAVGREVLAQALADSRVGEVIAPTRRALAAHARLRNPITDFAQRDAAAPWWQADAVVCALGTTIKVAGSQAAFAAVDRDLVIDTARLARQAGAIFTCAPRPRRRRVCVRSATPRSPSCALR